MSVNTELTDAWEAWQLSTLLSKWRAANPREAAALEAYRAGTGPRPSLVTPVGRALVAETAAWFETRPSVPEPAPAGMPDRSLKAWLEQPQIAELPLVTIPLAGWDGSPVAGKRLVVTGAGRVTTSQALRLSSWRGGLAAVQLDGVVFGDYVPMSASGGRRNLAIFGGAIIGSPTYGLLVSAATNLQWWGGRIQGCKRTGLLIHQNVGPNLGLDLALEISGCGFDLAADVHAEKGTGFHAAYLGSSDQRLGPTENSRFALWVRDQAYGAAAQIGNDFRDNQLWVDARRVSFQAKSQVAGNALQWWTKSIGSVTGNVVEYVYGEDLAGRLSETDGGWDPGNKILVARYKNVLLNPRLTREVCAPGVPVLDLKEVA